MFQNFSCIFCGTSVRSREPQEEEDAIESNGGKIANLGKCNWIIKISTTTKSSEIPFKLFSKFAV